MIKSSIKHLNDNNMSYFQHLKFAFNHGSLCIVAGLMLIIHSILPSVFQRAGSSIVNILNKSFIEHNELLSSFSKKSKDSV